MIYLISTSLFSPSVPTSSMDEYRFNHLLKQIKYIKIDCKFITLSSRSLISTL